MRLSELIMRYMPIKGIPDDTQKYIVARINDDWLSYVNSFDNKDDALCYAEKLRVVNLNGYLVARNNI